MKIYCTLFSLLFAVSGTAVMSQSCPTITSLTAQLSGANIVEQASQHLMAANEVRSGDVAYRAGASVTLTPGFEVKPGAVFEASIVACEAVAVSQETWNEGAFALGSYPNPFALNTKIEFALPEATTVSISIIDMKGVVISRLMTDMPQSEGTHRLTFESESLPDGAYICTMTTPLGRKTHKILKVR